MASQIPNRSKAVDRTTATSAACLAVFGIALSSFSLKQLLAKSTRK